VLGTEYTQSIKICHVDTTIRVGRVTFHDEKITHFSHKHIRASDFLYKTQNITLG